MSTADEYLRPTVSGLWGHSHDAENDLMKRFVVERQSVTKPLGWLALQSFDWATDAHIFKTQDAVTHLGYRYRTFDQFRGVVVF